MRHDHFKNPISPARKQELEAKRWSMLQMFGKGPKPAWAVRELNTIAKELGEIPTEKRERPTYA